jgi:hypothetical protein
VELPPANYQSNDHNRVDSEPDSIDSAYHLDREPSEHQDDHPISPFNERRRYHYRSPPRRTERRPARPTSPPPPESTHPRAPFYAALRPPFNVVPHTSYRKGYDVAKAVPGKTVPHFDGSLASYFPWRSAFVENIHPAFVPLNQKIAVIKETLNQKDPYLKKLVMSLKNSPDHYADALNSLEDRYGNPDRLVMELIDGIYRQDPIREGDDGALLGLIQELNSVRMTLEQSGLLEMYDTPMVYKAAVSLLPFSYQCAYHNWRKDIFHEERPSLVSLITFGRRQANTVSLAFIRTKHQTKSNSRALAVVDDSHNDNPNYGFSQLAIESDSHLKEFDYENQLVDVSEVADDDEDAEQAYVVRLAPKCTLCSGQTHLYRLCPAFQKLTPKERRNHLATNKKCFRCFRSGHVVSSCQSNITCKNCKEKHHTLVCTKVKEEVQQQQRLDTQNLKDPPARLPIVGVLLENPKTHKRVQTNALLDTGAQRTFVAEHLRTTLALTGHAEPYHSVGFGGVKTTFEYSVTCVLRVFNLDRTASALIKAATLPDPVGELYPETFADDLERHPELKKLHLAPTLAGVKVDMILGSDNAITLQSKEMDVLIPNGPMAKHSMFGYVLMGPGAAIDVRAHTSQEAEQQHLSLSKTDPFCVRSYTNIGNLTSSIQLMSGSKDHSQESHIENLTSSIQLMSGPEDHFQRAHKSYDRSLLDLLDKLHSLTDIDDAPDMSLDDHHAFLNFKKSLRWTGECYEAGCLWKKNEPCLPSNRIAAIKRLDSAIRNSKFKDVSAPVYNATISDYLQKGYIIKVDASDELTSAFYLPHFIVSKNTENGIKHRIVFDGAARFMNKSLNDAITKGPNFIADLVKVLIRFRKSKVAITFDVAEMFLQVQLPPSDQLLHRFVFRNTLDEPIITYQFTRHVFGNTGSPCVAMAVVRAKAEELAWSHPVAAKTALRSSIIDDTMTSVDTVEEAIQLYEGIKSIYSACSMKPHKIASNSQEVLKAVPDAEKAKGFHVDDLIADASPTTTTLGLLRSSKDDIYSFKVMEVPDNVNTMRGILKYTASLFDPLGFLAPYLILARLIIQACNKLKLGWDDPVPQDVQDDWEALERAWSRYQKEIVPQLHIVNKWLATRDNLRVGDVVVVMDDSNRGSFPLGKVTQVHPSPSDNLVRSISLLVGTNTWRRHVNGLLLLVRPEANEVDNAVIVSEKIVASEK